MKKISAVICELNPAHEGHKFIINEAKKRSECVVAIMSGNFVQRAETAIYDKYTRAEMALDIGADLVLELPFPWSSASAEYFASAGVSIAEKIGAELLVFGSESGDKDALIRASEILKREEFNSSLPGGVRAAEARQQMLRDADPTLPENLVSTANDILGVEYCKSLKTAEPCPIKRISCESATSIRKTMAENKKNYPNATFAEKLFELEYIKFRCQRSPETNYAECGGGVGERLIDSASKAGCGAEMLALSATKQYTDARLRRAALYALTEVTQSELKELPEFTTVLASNEKGRKLLSEMRKNKPLTIITKPSTLRDYDGNVRSQLELSMYADTIYALCADLDRNHFIKASPIIK